VLGSSCWFGALFVLVKVVCDLGLAFAFVI